MVFYPASRDNRVKTFSPYDVGLVLRRFLSGADDFFGDLLSLTLYDKLLRVE